MGIIRHNCAFMTIDQLPPSLLITEAVLFGLVIGSFLNVCISRIPLGLGLGGRSRCPQCEKQISWYDNIPVLSYIFLGARCRTCKKSISFVYPLVEIITALLAVACVLHFTGLSVFLWFVLFVCPLIVITFIDFEHQIIPDVISLPGIVIGIAVVQFEMWPLWTDGLKLSLLGIAVGGGSLLILGQLYLWIRKRDGMGGGDIKLSAMLGAFLGWQAVIVIFFLSSVLAIVYALTLTVIERNKEGPMVIPYGPFLSAAAVIYLFYGPLLLENYLALMRH